MKIVNSYPRIKQSINKFVMFKKIVLLLFFLSTVACVITNLSVGGKKWMFYVIMAEVIFYYTFLNKPLVDRTLVKRVTVVSMIVCAYLYMIDIIEKTSWSYFVINILLFSIIIVQLVLFFIEFRSKSRGFIPLFLTSLGSVILCVLAITNVIKINWAVIVLGSLGLGSLIMLFLFYRKMIFLELKKYWNVK